MKSERSGTATPSSLDLYLRDIHRIPLLTIDEERRLARAYREGDARAGDRLVTANLRFVVKIAREYRTCGLPLADLVQEGNIGLMKAVARFDPDRNTRLISYAVSWVRAYMLDHILKSHSLVKLGTTQVQRRLFFSLGRTRRELDRSGPAAGQEEESAELARRLRVKPREVAEMSLRLLARDLPLDASRGDDASRPSIGELLVDSSPPPDEALSVAQELQRVLGGVREALAQLDGRERYVVEQRAMSDSPESLGAIGGRLQVSSERVRQLELRATRKLRRELDPLAAQLRLAI